MSRHFSATTESTLQQAYNDGQTAQEYLYRPTPIPNKPQLAHIDHRRTISNGRAADQTRLQGSVSSSDSSGIMAQKQRMHLQGMSWPTGTAERTPIEYDGQYQHRSQDQHFYHDKFEQGQKRLKTNHTSPALAYIRDRRQVEDDDDDEEEEDHALWVLFWLSCLDPIHSLCGCLYTILIVIGLVLISPIRLCQKKTCLSDQIIRTLAPSFKNHLEMMYAESVGYAFEWDFRAGLLVVVQIVAPLISIGVAVASWITAAFWVFTSIMGNPDGTERRDDGRDAVLSIRNWWERCLLKAIRRQTRPRPQMRSVV